MRVGFSEPMKIFLSYPSGHKEAAASINYELSASGHEVFFDREDLRPGQSYNEKIRAAVEAAELFIFLITPQSIAQGHYTLTELKLAARKWPAPAGRVLPVMAEATPLDAIPAYLKAVTILIPEGNLTAEVLIEVAALAAAPPAKPTADESADGGDEALNYGSLEIRFGAGRDGSYPVAIASAAQPVAAPPCALDADGWVRELWSDSVAIAGAARRGQVGADFTAAELLPSEAAVRRVGERLYRALFNPNYRLHCARACAASTRSGAPACAFSSTPPTRLHWRNCRGSFFMTRRRKTFCFPTG